MRKAELARKTSETDIKMSLNIDGKGSYDIKTGIEFFDHMLNGFAKHGFFDLNKKIIYVNYYLFKSYCNRISVSC